MKPTEKEIACFTKYIKLKIQNIAFITVLKAESSNNPNYNTQQKKNASVVRATLRESFSNSATKIFHYVDI